MRKIKIVISTGLVLGASGNKEKLVVRAEELMQRTKCFLLKLNWGREYDK